MTIKLTGGHAKGHPLKVYQKGQVRPTSDKIRQAIFNILAHRFDFDFENTRVLDLYAGSGSLGAEAWSRGSIYLSTVESHKITARILKENLIQLQNRLSGTFRVNTQAVLPFLKSSPIKPFDLIFLDPPYQEMSLPTHLDLLESQHWVHPQSLVVMEHSKRHPFETSPKWEVAFRRQYGDTLVSICALTDEPV